MLINPLMAVRDIHFVSSVIVAGIVFFELFIASPVLRASLQFTGTAASFGSLTRRILWSNLILSLASALAWLCLVSARIVGKPIGEVIADGTIWTVLSRTQFGFAWEMRLLFGVLLAAFLLPRRAGAATWQAFAGVLLAASYLGSLAFAGHGAEGLGFERSIHLAADFLHLVAAGLWLGGLVPLVLLLACLRRFREERWVSAAGDIAGRFSNLGILAVGILLISGTINVTFMVGGLSLTETRYGRLLLLKITLFAAMVCLAGINRQHLLPRLSAGAGIEQGARAVQLLLRNALAEIILGLGIVVIVGILGIMAPINDMAGHLH